MSKNTSHINIRWPEGELVDDVISVLLKKLEHGENLALITLLDRVGATPRKIGSQMLVDTSGQYWGHVSGGCVEANLAIIAQDVISSGKLQFISLGTGGDFVDISLPCGSRIDLVIEAITPNSTSVKALQQAHAHRLPIQWIYNGELCSTSLESNKLRNAAGRDGNSYWWRHTPALRLMLHGHDAITLALTNLAQQMGWQIILNGGTGNCDTPRGFKGTYLSCGSEALLQRYPADPYTACISLMHDIEKDHHFLKNVLPSKAFYVGVLGSRQHLQERRQRLDAEKIAHNRLSAPVGLDIKAATPYEIAVSILAEIIEAKSA